jgi:hypothetical protein
LIFSLAWVTVVPEKMQDEQSVKVAMVALMELLMKIGSA